MGWLSDIFTMQFAAALALIVVIDLALVGDNTTLITLTTRSLPPELQKRAIMWGATGAIVVRALMTPAVMWLLRIPDLMLVGGLALVWIVWKLLANNGQGGDEHGAGNTTLMGTMKTIIIANTVVNIDNMLTIAGASHDSFLLVVLGLLISVPVAMWGSDVILRLIECFPTIIYGGVTVLTYTTVHMIVVEPMLKALFAAQPPLKWAVYMAVFLVVLGGGWLVQRHH